MKKIFAIFAAVICAVSCSMKWSSGYETKTSEKVIRFAIRGSEAVSIPYVLFRQLYCVHLYMTYTEDDRDTQWFARLGQCYTNGFTIKTEYRNLTIQTNGMAFTEEGAVYSVAGYTFTCFHEGESAGWVVVSEGASSEYGASCVYKVVAQDANGMTTGIKGFAVKFDYEYDGNRTYSDKDFVRYELDFEKPWTFSRTRDMGEISGCLYEDGDYPVGTFGCYIYYKGVQTDWVQAVMKGQKEYTYKTSRD